MAKYFNHGMRGGTDSFVNRNGVYLEFFHLPTSNVVRFKAFITDYSEAYNVNFNEQDVYGRMDPIAIYEGTKRKINLGWTVVAESHAEAYENWKKVQQYVKMLYPSYKKFIFDGKDTKRFSATTLAAPPLLKMRFMNLIADASIEKLEKKGVVSNTSVNKGMVIKKTLVDYLAGNAKDTGLLVVPGSLNINTNWADRGGILSGGKRIDPVAGSPTMRPVEYEDYISSDKFVLPLEVSLTSEFTVLHQHDLGTEKTVDKRGAPSGKLPDHYGKKVTSKQAADILSKQNQSATGLTSFVPTTRKIYGVQEVAKKEVGRKKKAQKQKIAKQLAGGARDKKGFEDFPYGIK